MAANERRLTFIASSITSDFYEPEHSNNQHVQTADIHLVAQLGQLNVLQLEALKRLLYC